MDFPTDFATRRLQLRRVAVDDAGSLYHAYASDPEVARFMTWRPHASVEDTRAWLESLQPRLDRGAGSDWTLRPYDEPDPCGVLSLSLSPNGLSLGYVLGSRWWGRGYVPEAASALVQWGLEQSGIWRVWATCDVENRASARVLEKIGMNREGTLRRWAVHPNLASDPRDSFMYAKTR